MSNLLVSCIFLVGFSSAFAKMIDVAVYYESLCPDSKAFITKELSKAMDDEKLAAHINLKMYSAGKSSYTLSGKDYNFVCHHGPEECKGNKIHDCAAHLIDNGENSKGLGYNKKTLKMVTCLMANFKKTGDTVDFMIQQCANQTDAWNFASQIKNCSEGDEGTRFLATAVTFTEKLSPQLKSVPTVTFGGVHDVDKSKRAIQDFTAVACEELGGEDAKQLEICSGCLEVLASRSLVLATLILAFFRLRS